VEDREDRLYVWFDTEYSDLDLEAAALLQVAAVITDGALTRVLPASSDVRLAVRLADGTALSQWVEEYFERLIAVCRSPAAASLEEADARLSAYVEAAQEASGRCRDGRPVLAGNSVHADWRLACRFLPRFAGRLHYRHLDVTAFKLEWKRRSPEAEFEKGDPATIRAHFADAVLPEDMGRHDAYYDVQASIAEMAFYREHLLRR
jgi:oligoribonuclease